MKLAGVKRVLGLREHSPQQFPLHTYYRTAAGNGNWGDFTDTLLSYQGGRIDVLPEDDVTEVGRVVGLDSSRIRHDEETTTVTIANLPEYESLLFPTDELRIADWAFNRLEDAAETGAEIRRSSF